MNSASKSTFPKKSTTFGNCCWQYICEENFDPLFDPYFALKSHLATCFNSAAANKNTKKCFGNNQSNMEDTTSDSENGSSTTEAYHFSIPNKVCGKLIGKKGSKIKEIRAATNCELALVGSKSNGHSLGKNNAELQVNISCFSNYNQNWLN